MRALWPTLLRFAPLPLTLVLVNLAVDPVRVASGDTYEAGIARMLVAGQNVTNIFNPKDAAVVQHVVERLPNGPEVIVLGSSRSKLVRSGFFATRSFFNNSVGGGGLTDYLAIYGFYQARDFKPKLAVIEVSPWVLEPAYKSIWEARYAPRRDLEAALLGDRPLAGTARVSARDYLLRLREIISPGYFQTSLMTWVLEKRQGAAGPASYVPFTPGEVPLGETQLTDGSVIYPESVMKETDRQQIRAKAIAYAAGSTGVPRSIVTERVAMFEALVRRLEQHGTHVVLYFPPYHPVTYEHIVGSPEGRLLPEVERTLHALAERTGSETIGSYNPQAAGFGEDDFFDPSHPNADAVARLFAGRWNHDTAAAADTSIRIASIQNPNGLETVDGKPFFWIGQGTSCISLKAGAAGWARISFQATPGPSLPETPKRRLLVTSSASQQTQVVVVETVGPFSVVVPVIAGLTEACFTPLDHASVARAPNGDTRPLLLGASAPRVESVAAPATAAAPSGPPPCRVTFGKGWYAAEGDGTNWHRWMSGPADVTITANAAGGATLTGNAVAVKRPNHVAVTAEGKASGGFDIPGGEWAFRPFGPVSVPLIKGDTHLVLKPANPAMTLPGDPRSLTVAIQNLHVTMNGATVPCALQP